MRVDVKRQNHTHGVIFSVEVPVAFSTRLHEDTITNDSPVIFGTVDLNIGDGYDEFTGNVFTNIRLS